MNTPSESMKFRCKIIMTCIFLILFGIVIANFFKISVIDNAKYQKYANDSHFGPIKISAHRGSIYDANGTPLARSASVYKVFIDPKAFEADLKSLQEDIDDENKQKQAGTFVQSTSKDYVPLPVSAEAYRQATVAFLADKLSVTTDDVEEDMKKDTQYSIIQTQVEKPVADEVIAYFDTYGFNSIHVDEDTKRYYPQNEIAASVIGFTSGDGEGAYGIEAYYNKYLAGTDGKIISAKDSKGNEMPYRYAKTYPAKDGNDIYLTIDTTLQYYLEKHLQEMVDKFEVKNRACAILMNAKTGAVYGMATCPGFDLNNPYEISDKNVADQIAHLTGDESETAKKNAREAQWKNKAIAESNEPGSVFKVITSSAAIEENVIDIQNDTFFCSGSQTVMGIPIGCDNTSGHGVQNFYQALTNSCNPAFMQIGLRLGVQKFCYYFRAFGLTEKTGIDLPGEGQSIYVDEKDMTDLDLACNSFGQVCNLTPMEMITSYAAVINGGYLLKPYVVDKIVDQDGNVVLSNQRTVRRQAISEDTSAIMRDALEKVVEGNGGGNVYIKGYKIGGKSGTSEKLGLTGGKSDGEDNSEYVASYVCFTPADDPELILLVMADMPNKKIGYYGSKVAVPTARDILTDALPYLGYYPEYSDDEKANLDVKVPLLQSKGLSEAKTTLDGMGLKYEVKGEGSTVVAQSPVTGTTVAKNGIVYLYTNEDYSAEFTTVPDLVGVSATNANEAIAYNGLNMVATGASITHEGAIVNSQSIKAGTKVPKGTVVQLEFLVNENSD